MRSYNARTAVPLVVLPNVVRRKQRADSGGDGLGPREDFDGVFCSDGTVRAADFGGVAARDVELSRPLVASSSSGLLTSGAYFAT